MAEQPVTPRLLIKFDFLILGSHTALFLILSLSLGHYMCDSPSL
jgi:hypothetical protein